MKEIRALNAIACIAQSVERQPFKLVVVGSSPTVGNYRVKKNTSSKYTKYSKYLTDIDRPRVEQVVLKLNTLLDTRIASLSITVGVG